MKSPQWRSDERGKASTSAQPKIRDATRALFLGNSLRPRDGCQEPMDKSLSSKQKSKVTQSHFPCGLICKRIMRNFDPTTSCDMVNLLSVTEVPGHRGCPMSTCKIVRCPLALENSSVPGPPRQMEMGWTMTGHVGTSGIMWHHAPVHVAWCFDYVCTKKPETFMKSESFGIKTKEVFACELMMAGTQGFIFVFHAWLTNYPYKKFHKLIYSLVLKRVGNSLQPGPGSSRTHGCLRARDSGGKTAFFQMSTSLNQSHM